MGNKLLVFLFSVMVSVVGFATDPADTEVIDWPDSNFSYKIKFTGIAAGLSVQDNKLAQAKSILRGFPIWIPFNQQSSGIAPPNIIFQNAAKYQEDYVLLVGESFIYLNKHGIAMVIEVPLDSRPEPKVIYGQSVNLVVYKSAIGDHKSFLIYDNHILEVPVDALPKGAIRSLKVAPDKEQILINDTALLDKGAPLLLSSLPESQDIKQTFKGIDIVPRDTVILKLHDNGPGIALDKSLLVERPASAGPVKLSGVQIAQKKGRVHPSLSQVKVSDNDGKEVLAWDLIKEFVTDLDEKFQNAVYVDDLVEREIEDAIVLSLHGQEIANVKYLGPAGSGKTTSIRNLVQRRLNNDEVADLNEFTFLQLNPSAFETGGKWAGTIATKLNALGAILETSKIIILVDEVHTLKGLGTAGEKSADITQTLKPYAADGRLRMVGISTEPEWNTAFRKDTAWDSRFILVNKEEPSGDRLIHMLQSWAKRFKYPELSYDAAQTIINYSNRFDAVGAQPRRAVKLMDLLYSYMKVKGNRSIAPSVQDVKLAAQKLYRIDPSIIDENLRRESYERLRTDLAKMVAGQEQAKEKILESELHVLTESQDFSKPMYRLLLLGNIGTGHASLVQTVATSTRRNLEVLNMSDYRKADSLPKLHSAL